MMMLQYAKKGLHICYILLNYTSHSPKRSSSGRKRVHFFLEEEGGRCFFSGGAFIRGERVVPVIVSSKKGGWAFLMPPLALSIRANPLVVEGARSFNTGLLLLASHL